MNAFIRWLAVAAVGATALAAVPAMADNCITSPTDISCGPANMNPANPLSPLNPASPFYPKPDPINSPTDTSYGPANMNPANPLSSLNPASPFYPKPPTPPVESSAAPVDDGTTPGPNLLEMIFGSLAGPGAAPAPIAMPADAPPLARHRHRRHHHQRRHAE